MHPITQRRYSGKWNKVHRWTFTNETGFKKCLLSSGNEIMVPTGYKIAVEFFSFRKVS